MKTTPVILLLACSMPLFSQYMDGPANVRDAPGGEKLFSLNDWAQVTKGEVTENGDWHTLILDCMVWKDQWMDGNILANSPIYNVHGDSIGFTYQKTPGRLQGNPNYGKGGKIPVRLEGFTHRYNLRPESTFSEKLAHSPKYLDSCQSSYLSWEEPGRALTRIENCRFYRKYVEIGGRSREALVREYQEIERYSGREGQLSTIQLKFIFNELDAEPEIRPFSAEADKLTIERQYIETVKYGCCGAPNTYWMYDLATLQPVMEYNELFKVEVGNSNTKLYLGYKMEHYDPEIGVIGTLTLTDGKEVINKVNFLTWNEATRKGIPPFPPLMEFAPMGDRGKVQDEGAVLQLRPGSKPSGFRFIIHFINDATGEDYTQELEVTNGRIFGNTRVEFDIEID